MKKLTLLMIMLLSWMIAQSSPAEASKSSEQPVPKELRSEGVTRIGFAIDAQFSVSQQVSTLGTMVVFTDESSASGTAITGWSWDFNDDDVEDSAEQSPSYEFMSAGHYYVTLTVTDGLVHSSFSMWLSVVADDIDSSLSYIPFKGLENNNQGIIAWNADTDQYEPAKMGHLLPQPPASIQVAYYYLASRDYSDIDPLSSSGLSGSAAAHNWPALSQALVDNGKSTEDLEISFGYTSLGNDISGVDWSLIGTLEMREYTGGTFTIKLNGEEMITGMMPQIHLNLDYYAHLGGTDKIYGDTEYAVPVNTSAGSGAIAQAIAAAFMEDCEHFDIKFIFASMQSANQFQFYVNDRWGGFFEVAQGFLIKEGPCTIEVEACDDLVLDAMETDTLSATVMNYSDTVSYAWSPAAGLDDSTLARPEVQIAISTEYILTVTDARGCTSTDTVWVNINDIPVGLNDLDKSNKIKVIISDNQTSFRSQYEVIKSLSVYDINGRMIVNLEPNSTLVQLRPLSKGVYVVRCATLTGVSVHKVVVR